MIKYFTGFVAGLIIGRLLCKKQKKPKGKILFTVFINHSQFQTNKMKIQKGKFPVSGHIAPTADSGAAEAVQSVSYSSSNEAAVTVAANPDDATKFQLTFVGAGIAQISATADADLGDGVVTLTDSLEVTAEEDEATKLNMVLDL